MRIILIIAISKNGCIGIDNKLPWLLKDDFKHFKETTINSPIIMGRKTFESLPGILPNREHIVLTSCDIKLDNATQFDNIDDIHDYLDNKSAYLIGGAETIKLFSELKMIDEYIITHVDGNVDGDTFIDLEEDLEIDTWNEWKSEEYTKNDNNDFDFTIKWYKKDLKRFYQ